MATEQPLAADLLAKVWALGAGMYGGLWTAAYGEEPSAVWAFGLAGLDRQEVLAGMRRLRERAEKQPPTCPEFRSMCRPPDERTPEQRALYGRIERERAPALPPLERVAADGGSVGRRWYAYWLVRGLRPWPRELDADTVDGWLEGADLDAMDRECRGAAARMGYLEAYDAGRQTDG